MEGRGKSRRRNPFRIWKRRMGAVLAFVLTASLILNMPLSIRDFGLHVSDAYASGSNAQREDAVWATASNAKYKKAKTQDVDIYVIAEDSEAAAGNMSSMTLYLRNNTGEEITDGVLKFKANHIAQEDGYFTDVQVENEETAVMNSDNTSAEISGEGLLYQEESIPAETDGQEMLPDDSDEWSEEETEEEEYNTLTGIDLAPGELYEVRFDFYTADDEKSTKAYVKFSFEGEGAEKKAKGEEKFYYSIGLPFVNVELAEGYELESGVQNEMNIWMSEPTWMDEDLEERVDAIEEAEAEKELDEAVTATGSEAGKATDSNAEKASPSDASVSEKIEKYTQEAMTISESRVSYEVEIWGTEYEKFRPKKAQEAEDIGWISCLYEVARDAEPGIYYGKVSATGKWNRKSFASQQGFLFEVTGEGKIVLNGQLDGMEIQVSGPASAFPEAEELSISVSEVPDEQKAQVEEALKKKSEEEGIEIGRYRALDIRLYADGEETEPSGELQVAFKNMELTEQVTDESEISIQSENAPESSEQAGIAVLSADAAAAEQATAGTETAGEEAMSASKMNAGDNGSIKVYHLDEEETVANEMESSVEDSGDVVMTTDHFSVYIVVETEDIAGSIQLTLQHWAEVETLSDVYPVTSADQVTSQSTIFLPNESNLAQIADSNKRTLKHGTSYYQIYKDDIETLSDGTSIDLEEYSKVMGVDNANYRIFKVYMLKSGEELGNEKTDADWENTWRTKWTDITSAYTNPETPLELSDDTVIRFVYEGVSGVSSQDAAFYDYDVYIGNRDYGANNSNNFSRNADWWLGFTNYSARDGLYPSQSDKFNSTNNIYADGKAGYKNFVQSTLSNGQIQYSDDGQDAGLFDGTSPYWKHSYNGYHLNFNRTGDTYIISSVSDNQGNKVVSRLNEFQKRANKIWTNDFWALDTKRGREAHRSDSAFDTQSHNWFFGMYYTFTFKLGDYTGPLTYCFCGDDDFWLYIDGQLAVDLGGNHDPMGRVINLYNFIDATDTEKEHEIVIYYLERGGHASTCYMEFTIPNVTVLPNFPETDLTKVTVKKDWKNSDGSVIAGSEGLPDKVMVTLLYKEDDAADSEYKMCRTAELTANNNWSYTWELPATGYDYKVVETPVDGFETGYSNPDGVLSYDPQTHEYEITIINRKMQSIAVEKKWTDGVEGSALVSEERPTDVTVQLYWKKEGGNTAYTPYTKTDGSKYYLTLNAANEWSGSFDNLPVYYDGGSSKAEYFVYEVKQDTVPGEYVMIGEADILPSKSGQAGYKAHYEKEKNNITITNTLCTVDLNLHKIGKQGDTEKSNALEGAVFTLNRINPSMSWEQRSTGADGKVSFTGLPGGSYTLTEIKAPDGYSIAGPWTFTVSADGVIQFDNVSTDSDGYFIIENQAGAELPETGGPGLIMFERFGWMLLLMAMLGVEVQMLSNRKKRR